MGDYQGHPFRGNQHTAGFPSPEGGFHDPTRDAAPPAEAGFAYHATNEERAREIAESGKLDVHRPDYGTEQDAWPDGSTAKRAYFTDNPGVAGSFAPEEGRAVLLRVPSAGMGRESTGDRFTTKPVAAGKVEILGRDGKWHRITPDDYEKNPAKDATRSRRDKLGNQIQKGIAAGSPGIKLPDDPFEGFRG